MSSSECKFDGKETVSICDRRGTKYLLSRSQVGKFSRIRNLLYGCGVAEIQAALQENENATPPAESECAACQAKLICRNRGNSN